MRALCIFCVHFACVEMVETSPRPRTRAKRLAFLVLSFEFYENRQLYSHVIGKHHEYKDFIESTFSLYCV